MSLAEEMRELMQSNGQESLISAYASLGRWAEQADRLEAKVTALVAALQGMIDRHGCSAKPSPKLGEIPCMTCNYARAVIRYAEQPEGGRDAT